MLGVAAGTTKAQCVTAARHLNKVIAACGGADGLVLHELTCQEFGAAAVFFAEAVGSHEPLRGLVGKIVSEFTRGTLVPDIQLTGGRLYMEDADTCTAVAGALEDAYARRTRTRTRLYFFALRPGGVSSLPPLSAWLLPPPPPRPCRDQASGR